MTEESGTTYDALQAGEVNGRLLAHSGLLDVASYCAAAGVPADADAAAHYLLYGWRANLEPSARFEGRFLYPYYRSAGLDGPPALTYLTVQAAGWPVYATRAHAQDVANLIASSPLFDAAHYAAATGPLDGLDPALHYVLVGEQLGLKPSAGFDPGYYAARYPDVARAAMNRLAHFVAAGRREGRRATSVADTLRFARDRIRPARPTILLVAHEASRTGAPVLAYNIAVRLRDRYNVVAVLLGDGELFDQFDACCAAAFGPIPRSEWNDVEAKHLIARLCAIYDVHYAIANSIETRFVLPSLAHAFVPVVTLVHEFASYTRPAGTMGQALDWSTEVVFSAGIVAASARREHPTIDGRTIHVLPQGPCPAPPPKTGVTVPGAAALLQTLSRQKTESDAFVVLGCGTVHLRKGVDLFLSCAAAVARLAPRRPVRFVWIGDGYRPGDDPHYSCYLADHIERAGLAPLVFILDAVGDLEPAYALADLFLLSSRLDPLPNVAIDAALRGTPIVCFDQATGMADVLAQDAIAGRLVVPYLDVARAAAAIARLADDERERREIGNATQRLAREAFDTERYVRRLDELGVAAVEVMRQRQEDFATLRHDPSFDAGVYLHPKQPPSTRDEAISSFLARWRAVGIIPRAASNGLFRRPCVGFHPQIYAYDNGAEYDVSCVNPLAHFIRARRPPGPWVHEVIVPLSSGVSGRAPQLKVALHGHFYYPSLAVDMLRALRTNRTECDLWLTTDTEDKAQALYVSTRGYDRGKVCIRLVPNRGRDIGPLLTAIGVEIQSDYDVVGHVHSKRSVGAGDRALGESWRDFLWQHLLGDRHPMMDVVLARFVDDPTLGLVFAEDPYLSDWDDNAKPAAELALRMGIAALPPFFDFPNGTMFWARTAALRPLIALGLHWDDYPEEPVPNDGTILHALERLVPFAAQKAGFRYATTHLSGVTR